MQQRSIPMCIVLSLVTCGIYGIFWFISLTNDTVQAHGSQVYRTSGGMAFLFSLITCGIYMYYWNYQMGKAVYVAQQQRGGAGNDNSILYIILAVCGLSIISYCLIQNDLNNLPNS